MDPSCIGSVLGLLIVLNVVIGASKYAEYENVLMPTTKHISRWFHKHQDKMSDFPNHPFKTLLNIYLKHSEEYCTLLRRISRSIDAILIFDYTEFFIALTVAQFLFNMKPTLPKSL